jgi:hypothetical protein
MKETLLARFDLFASFPFIRSFVAFVAFDAFVGEETVLPTQHMFEVSFVPSMPCHGHPPRLGYSA